MKLQRNHNFKQLEKEFALIGSTPCIDQTSLPRSLLHSSLMFNDIFGTNWN